ncbi:MAG TPA: hypothetical protein VGZ47_10805 [Gemmataceae bacterium]|nr:hypothetical protein [Gemmataceae bacterium]
MPALMRRIAYLLVFFCTGCYTPLAEVLDRVRPSPVRPEMSYPNLPPPNSPPLVAPSPGDLPPPLPPVNTTPGGNTSPVPAPSITPFAPDPALPNT